MENVPKEAKMTGLCPYKKAPTWCQEKTCWIYLLYTGKVENYEKVTR
jgi:hypothetical protein